MAEFPEQVLKLIAARQPLAPEQADMIAGALSNVLCADDFSGDLGTVRAWRDLANAAAALPGLTTAAGITPPDPTVIAAAEAARTRIAQLAARLS